MRLIELEQITLNSFKKKKSNQQYILSIKILFDVLHYYRDGLYYHI